MQGEVSETTETDGDFEESKKNEELKPKEDELSNLVNEFKEAII